MGYYSEVGVAMFKEDFEQLLEETKEQTSPNDRDTYHSLTEYCDHYYIDEWQDWVFDKKDEKMIRKYVGPVKTIVILHWNWIKSGAMGIQRIFDTVRQKGGCFGRVGEETGDIEFEQYDPPGLEGYGVEWYEYLEPQAYVQIEGGKEQIDNYEDFTKAMRQNEVKKISAGRR